MEEPCVICGGGALHRALIQALESELKVDLLVPPIPQITTALGAAILARAAVTEEMR